MFRKSYKIVSSDGSLSGRLIFPIVISSLSVIIDIFMLYCHYEWARSLLSTGMNISQQKFGLALHGSGPIFCEFEAEDDARLECRVTCWMVMFDCFHLSLIYL